MSEELQKRAHKVVFDLAALDESKNPGGGWHGQMVGCEPYVIRSNGYGLQCLYDAQELIRELLERATPSTIPASEAGELPTFDAVWDAIDWGKWRSEPIRELVRHIHALTTPAAALASTRTASEQEIVTAGDCMARWLYGLSQSEAVPESWRTTCAELAQAWKGTASGEVNAGAARQGGNTCKESGEVDVEAEHKLCASAYEAIYTGRAEGSGFAGFFKGWLAKARTQADAGKDAERYRYLRAADWSEIESIFWSHEVQSGNSPDECCANLDREIDARIQSVSPTTKPENT